MPDAPAHTPPRKRRGWQGPGPGRKSLNDPTKTVAVPLAILAEVERLIAEHRGRRNALLKAADDATEAPQRPVQPAIAKAPTPPKAGQEPGGGIAPEPTPEPAPAAAPRALTPLEQGRAARQAGAMLAANPFDFGSSARQEWAAGWWSPKS